MTLMPHPKYLNWLNSPLVDDKTKEALTAMDDKTIIEHFSKDLEFGTAGIRGILAPGSNKLNIFTIRKASLAYAQYLLRHYKDARSKGIVIAHDNRHMSYEFSLESAKVFATHGIKTYLFKGLRPTPQLSFTVRELKAVGGVVITASHNPKEYNGFKVYTPDGGQLVPAQIDQLLPFYLALENELDIKISAAANDPLIITLNEEIDTRYYEAVNKIRMRQDLKTADFKIVFSPQHGAGYLGVNYLLKKAGYQLINVEAQCSPDPDFSHTKSPNPEEAKAYELAILKAQATKANLILTTDPDADRLGLAILKNEQPIYFTGNQTGALLIDYIIKTLKELNKFKNNHIIYNTIVTSQLGAKIAINHGVKVVSTLTGFKFIGEQILGLETKKDYDFIFGYEESYGYLIDEKIARDKDALQAVVLIAEMANYYAKQGLTLDVVLQELYQKYGYHLEQVESITLAGVDGAAKIVEIMNKMRASPLTQIGNDKVKIFEDYLSSKRYENNKVSKIELPSADVLRFTLENESQIAVRPSGTEPKIKFYYNIVANTKGAGLAAIEAYKKVIKELIK
jgi:phosphoglucomutase